MKINTHISEAIKYPTLINVKNNLYVLRFESMKIFSALEAVKLLLEKGTITKNTILIDSSSGTYAYALALACHSYGLKCHIVASIAVDSTTKLQLELMGATVECVPRAENLKFDQNFRIEKIKSRLKENKNYYWIKQYHDQIHYEAYYKIADKVYSQLKNKNLFIVGGVGSGCSTGGLTSRFRDLGANVHLSAVQPFGSVSFGAEKTEDPENIIAGIGSAIDIQNINYNLYDSINWISYKYSLSGCFDLMNKHAIFSGYSTGASWCIASHFHKFNPKTSCIVISPDTGHRYIDSVFSHSHLAIDINNLEPKLITHGNQLSLPWSKYCWNRKAKSHIETFREKHGKVKN